MTRRILTVSTLVALAQAKAIITNNCPQPVYLWSVPKVSSINADSLALVPGASYEEPWRYGTAEHPGIAMKISLHADGIHQGMDEINFAYSIEKSSKSKIWVDLSPIRGSAFDKNMAFYTCHGKHTSLDFHTQQCQATDNIELVLCGTERTWPAKDEIPMQHIANCYDYHHNANNHDDDDEDNESDDDMNHSKSTVMSSKITAGSITWGKPCATKTACPAKTTDYDHPEGPYDQPHEYAPHKSYAPPKKPTPTWETAVTKPGYNHTVTKYKTVTHPGYKPHYTSEVHYSHPHYTSQEHYAPPKYTSEAHYEPPYYTSTEPYHPPKYTSKWHYEPPRYTSSKHHEPPKYTSSKHYEPPKYTSSEHYEPPKYTSSKEYDPPKYTSFKNYEPPKHTSWKNYEPPKYTSKSKEHYEPPQYKSSAPYHAPKYTSSKPHEPPHYTPTKPHHPSTYTSEQSYPKPPKYTSEKPEYKPALPKYTSEDEYGRPPMPTYRPLRRSDCAQNSGDSNTVCRARPSSSHRHCKARIVWPEQLVQASHNSTQIGRAPKVATTPLKTVMQQETNNAASAGTDLHKPKVCIKYLCQIQGLNKKQCKALEKSLEEQAKKVYDLKVDYTTDDDVCDDFLASLNADAWSADDNLSLARVALISRALIEAVTREKRADPVKYCSRDLCRDFKLTVDKCNAEMDEAERFMKEKYNVAVDFSTDDNVCAPGTQV